jgi:hypothetical protein
MLLRLTAEAGSRPGPGFLVPSPLPTGAGAASRGAGQVLAAAFSRARKAPSSSMVLISGAGTRAMTRPPPAHLARDDSRISSAPTASPSPSGRHRHRRGHTGNQHGRPRHHRCRQAQGGRRQPPGTQLMVPGTPRDADDNPRRPLRSAGLIPVAGSRLIVPRAGSVRDGGFVILVLGSRDTFTTSLP